MEILPYTSASSVQTEHYMQHLFLPPARVHLWGSATGGWKKLWRAQSFPIPPSFLAQFLAGVNSRCAIFAACRTAQDLTHSPCSPCPNSKIRTIAPSVQGSDNITNFFSVLYIKGCKNIFWRTQKLGQVVFFHWLYFLS